MKPTVSVVVATYKRDVSLKKALESLGKQIYTDFEIILVDDNGDGQWNKKTFDISEKFRQSYPQIPLNYIVNTPNQGSARARNIGIEASLGEFVTFLDDDDLYLPKKIQRQVEFMQGGDYDFSITDLDLFDENDKLIDRRIRNFVKESSSEALLRYHLKYHLTGTDTMMFKKDYLVAIGKFAPIDVGDEFYLMQRAIDGKGKFGYLTGSDVKAYVHTKESGLSSGEGKIAGEDALYEYKKKYFTKLSSKDKRYIKMRHYAVLAFAYLRMRKPVKATQNAMSSFFVSPMQCVKLFLDRKL